jgi:hypothetical protein
MRIPSVPLNFREVPGGHPKTTLLLYSIAMEDYLATEGSFFSSSFVTLKPSGYLSLGSYVYWILGYAAYGDAYYRWT